MKKIPFIVLAMAITLSCSEKMSVSKPQTDGPKERAPIARKPAVAGKFYPSDRKELEKMVDGYLSKASLPQTKGMITALIIPHAGYEYSGQVAAYGFKELAGEDVDTVILIGNSHRSRFNGVSIYPEGSFETPLGSVEIDSSLARSIMKENKAFSFHEPAHMEEHSLEVELPFLQRTLKNFKIVPMLFGNGPDQEYKLLASAILKNIKERNVLLVASSDLSHYPSYKDAKLSDDRIIKAILTGDPSNLERAIAEIEGMRLPKHVTCACGSDAIKTVMEIEKGLGAKDIVLLNAANSGDVTNDKDRVVGYASIGFFAERRGTLLNKIEQKKLLEIAKTSVESAAKRSVVPNFKNDLPMLNQKLGAFVTLKEAGQLRGCIGRFSPTDIPLYQVVSQMAVSAATEDHRFPPVSGAELPKIEYEISVLSLLHKIDDWREITLGRDGVKIAKGFNSGVFLPQVATETGWDMDRFMNELCSQKAGLPRNCWKDKGTELYTFTAQVFDEK